MAITQKMAASINEFPSRENERTNSSDLTLDTENIYESVCHKCPKDIDSKAKDKRRLIIVSIICIVFLAAEVAGGIAANSLAIASDAAHLLTDFGGFMVSLTAIWISSKPRTSKMSFGFYRAEVLGALLSVLSIWLITGILVYLAIQRTMNLNFELNPLLMIYVSLGGIAANLIMGSVLIRFKGGSNTFKELVPSTESLNIQSAIIHVIGDLLQSIGVFVASLIIHFKPSLKIMDPICTYIFSVLVLFTTLRVLKDIFRVLMEGFPKHLNFSEVKTVLFSIPGVVRIHNLRIWSLNMEKVALSAHFVISKGSNQSEVLKTASAIIGETLNIYEVTLQIEEIGESIDMCSICNVQI